MLLMGPTGAGKSDLALELAGRLPLEIISVDSAMVYRGMDIGTAKPTAAARAAVAHHLLDIRDPAERYSAGEFVDDAALAMAQIWQRGRLPLLVGGTMLYFHALTCGIAALPEADFAIRADIDARAAVVGWREMHGELMTVDPVAAVKIHANDAQRIQRALEVFRITGQPISRLQAARCPVLEDVEIVEFALVPERGVLHDRIEVRFAAMLAAGFLDEVRELRKRSDLGTEHPSMRAVGYRQLWKHLAGQCELNEAVGQAVVATRQLAKRQMTWLRARTQAQWIDPMLEDAPSFILNALSRSTVAPWS